jgi:glutathione S-transferase
MSEIKLYVLPASHPCAAVEAALRLKSMPFERIDLLPMTQLLVGPPRYRGKTVPGIRIGGERLTGSRTIMRRLDELTPEPSLLPEVGDPARVRVLEVECWGDEEFQDVARDILPRAFVRNPAVMESFVADDFKLPLPRAMLRPSLPLTARLMTLRSKTSDQTARSSLAALPDRLDRVDAWIGDGLLGGEHPNAADLQIGSTVRLLSAIADVRPLIAGRPAAALTRYFPPMVGEVPAGTLPAEWRPAPARA